MQSAKDYLTEKFGEDYSREAAMYFSYDVKYGGGKSEGLGLGKESATTTAARNYIKQAYDALKSDAEKTEFLKNLGDFYLTVGVGRARRLISDYAKTGKGDNEFIAKLFGATTEKQVKPEDIVAETGTHNIGVNAVTKDLFAPYGLQSLSFTYKKSDFESKNLAEPVEGMAHYVLSYTSPDGKQATKEGDVANHILGAYFSALASEDADTVKQKLGDILHMFETKGDIAVLKVPEKKSGTDLALDLVSPKGLDLQQEQQVTPLVRPLESTIGKLLNPASLAEADWQQIYSTLQSAKPEELKTEIDGIIAALNKPGISAEDKAKNDFALLQLASMYGFIGGKTKATDTKSKTDKEVFGKINGKSLLPYCMSVLPPALQPSVNCVKETAEARQAYNNFFSGLFFDWNKMSINENYLQNPETFIAELKKNLPIVAQSVSVVDGVVSVTALNAPASNIEGDVLNISNLSGSMKGGENKPGVESKGTKPGELEEEYVEPEQRKK
ncbi:MAG: hypothetical protein WC506_02935 [Candidatus Micrarchaeia archaeon]